MNTANKMAISVVKNYIERLECIPVHYWRSSEFAQKCYSIMAANDILELLSQDEDEPPLGIIEEYREKMDEYSCVNSTSSFIFSVSHDTAEDIVDELIKAYY